MTIRKLTQVLTVMLAVSGLSTIAAYAQSKPTQISRSDTKPTIPATINLAQITCRSVLKMPADDRAFTLVFFHGYMSGKYNETMLNGEQLATITDKIADACIDRPETPLMQVFAQFRSGSQK